MDFTTQIRALADRIPNLLDRIHTEEATKQYLIIPFIQALGYDIYDPREVVPEFDANVGASKKFKLDYAILKDDKPIILIECKSKNDNLSNDNSYTQLFAYFAALDARIAILTNGIIYRFYADLDKNNKMDERPFLEINILDLKESSLDELKKITKATFNVDDMITAATELKFIGGIVNILGDQMNNPTDDFTSIFYKRLCPEKIFTPTAKKQFEDYTKRAFKQFIRDRFSELLDKSELNSSNTVEIVNSSPQIEEEKNDKPATKIFTTQEELEGFYLIKSILRDTIDTNRIIYNDVQSYFGIFLDKRSKPICRLYFNNLNNLRIGLFDLTAEEKQEEKIFLQNLDDIYRYANRVKATVAHYERASSPALPVGVK